MFLEEVFSLPTVLQASSIHIEQYRRTKTSSYARAIKLSSNFRHVKPPGAFGVWVSHVFHGKRIKSGIMATLFKRYPNIQTSADNSRARARTHAHTRTCAHTSYSASTYTGLTVRFIPVITKRLHNNKERLTPTTAWQRELRPARPGSAVPLCAGERNECRPHYGLTGE